MPDGAPREETAAAPRPGRVAAAVRGLALDVGPLRESRDFRLLWSGQLVALTGQQITAVAVPWQVYHLTRSTLDVGMIGLVQLAVMIPAGLYGGTLADRHDRRRVMLLAQTGAAAATAMLLAGTLMTRTPLWYLYLAAALTAGLLALQGPSRTASTPTLVSRRRLPAALALNQVMFNATVIVGPGVGGLLIALGLRWAYGADLVAFAISVSAVLALRPLRPRREDGDQAPARGAAAIVQGLRFLRGRPVLISTFGIDLIAMVFGMPRAVFPAMAATVFHAGPVGYGMLVGAVGAGGLVGALTSGWIGGIRRQGLAVVAAVVVWGAAITGFGLARGSFPLALLLLAVAGGADMVSAVFRSTILQLAVPDSLRGRLSAVHQVVVTGGPRLGDVETGIVAQLTSPMVAVVSGGLACVAGALILAAAVPGLPRHRSDHE